MRGFSSGQLYAKTLHAGAQHFKKCVKINLARLNLVLTGLGLPELSSSDGVCHTCRCLRSVSPAMGAMPCLDFSVLKAMFI